MGEGEGEGEARPLAYSHRSGGVIVIDCAVNSSSKYRVSISDVTCGLKGGMSWERRDPSWSTGSLGSPPLAPGPLSGGHPPTQPPLSHFTFL